MRASTTGKPSAVHAEPLHDHDGRRGGRSVGRMRRPTAGLCAPRYVKPIRATSAARRSMIHLLRARPHGPARRAPAVAARGVPV